jgi:transposase
MPKKRILEGNVNEIEESMKNCDDPNEYRRIQCVYLGLKYPEISAKKIGEITLYSEDRIWIIHKKYREGGLEALRDSRGGRYREYMSVEEEIEFLKPFEQKSQTGTLIVVGEIKKAYEQKIGKEVAESTIYRLLARHDFRKIVPYKRHKKGNNEEQKAFKKTSLQ